VARGRVYVTGYTSPGRLYVIDPTSPPGAVVTLSGTLGDFPDDIATDGRFIWTANTSGTISKIDPDTGATTTLPGAFIQPIGIVFDGANLWVTDYVQSGALRKLDSNGNVIQQVLVGNLPRLPVFDGSNIWVPNTGSASVTVVRARDGAIVATLTGNGLNAPIQAAFDGQYILVTNQGGNNVSLWKATDLTPVGTFSTGLNTRPFGACSDGINFWITLVGTNQLARF